MSVLRRDDEKCIFSYCKQQGILYEFSLNTYKKRKLSEKQSYWRSEINRLNNIKV